VADTRNWHVTEALTSVRRLRAILPDLRAEEVVKALQLEVESANRANIVRLLTHKAAELNQHVFLQTLKEKLKHGTY